MVNFVFEIGQDFVDEGLPELHFFAKAVIAVHGNIYGVGASTRSLSWSPVASGQAGVHSGS
jgi:hypothetical protein